jgi:hypothetical protein
VIEETSEPASGSVSANAATAFPVAAREAHGVCAQALHDEGGVGERGRVGEFLADDAERAHVEARVRLRAHREAQQVGLREQRDERAEVFVRSLVRLRRVGLDLAPHETRHARRKPAVIVVEERRVFDESIHSKLYTSSTLSPLDGYKSSVIDKPHLATRLNKSGEKLAPP